MSSYNHSQSGGRMEPDASYLTEQVANIIAQLHGLFDEIGVPPNERDSRESELFAALSETLDHQLKLVSNEKQDLHTSAQRLATTIRQLQASLNDREPGSQSPHHDDSDPELQITYPLRECLARLEEKHHNVERIHQDRLDQVNKLVTALTSYSSHLDPSLLTVPLPPSPCPPTFSLSASYVSQLDNAFTSIYEIYQSRVAHVRALATELITLWAELGTPAAQTDQRVVECAEACPEQLGLREADLKRLQATRDRFANERAGRERKVAEVGGQIRSLWERLGVDAQYRAQFERRNRGVGMKVLNEFEEEHRRLLELKRQNLGVFVEEARVRLQELWDELFYSEEEMLAFTPAFSDVHTDALLASHEAEITRLTAIQSERAPILSLVSKHRTLLEDRASLAASSQDASRLMMRGQKGEKRDPGKLLREEKMRKRIQKELPKVEAELRKKLMDWEAEYGREFLVWGDRYLDELEDGAIAEAASKQPTRSRTPAAPAAATRNPRLAASTTKPPHGTIRGAPPRAKTPTPYTTTSTSTGTIRAAHHTRSKTAGSISPSKIPARVPLHPSAGNNASPTRSGYNKGAATLGRQAAPPPRMDLSSFIPPRSQTPVDTVSAASSAMGSVVRAVPPEDVYDDGRQSRLRLQHLQGGSTNVSAYGQQMHGDFSRAPSSQAFSRPPSVAASMRSVESGLSAGQSHLGSAGAGSRAGWYPMAPPPPPSTLSSSSYGSHPHSGASSVAGMRQISTGSSQSAQSGTVSGSENWETYSESGSELAVHHAAGGYDQVRGYDARGFPVSAKDYLVKHATGHNAHGGRAGTAEAEWTDEDAF